MRFLIPMLQGQQFYGSLLECINKGTLPLELTGCSFMHKAHVTAAVCSATGRKALIVAGDESEAAHLLDSLRGMGVDTRYYPVRDLSFHPLEGRSREFEHERIDALCALLSGECDVVVTVADAAMQLTLPPEQLSGRTVTLEEGGTADVNVITASLLAGGYERAESVEGPGQFAVRGGIVDFYPTASKNPVRCEMWGDEIDTLSYFDADSQRRTEPVDEPVRIYPAAELTVEDTEALSEAVTRIAGSLKGAANAAARERLYSEAESLRSGLNPVSCDKYLPLICEREATIFDYMPEDALIIVSEHTAVRERAHSSALRMSEEVKALIEDGVLCKPLSRYTITESELTDHFGSAIYMDTFPHGSYDTPIRQMLSMDARQLPPWDGTTSLLVEDLAALRDAGASVLVFAGYSRAADTLCDDLREAGFNAVRSDDPEEISGGRIYVAEGALPAGFEYPAAKLAVITWGRGASYSGRKSGKKIKARYKKGADIQSLSELSTGDYVVHITHGIGLFGGIVKLNTEGVNRDYIKITYAKSDVLYVPVTQLDMVSKYIGAKEESGVRLSSLGGTDWARQKSRVRKAVKDIAKELIKLYSERMRADGYPFDEDTEFQRDFEARFEYEETDDQLRCIDEIKKDMERPVPMERLLCGDVGFGKTEVALRAAFKCMVEGRQCAILAPTTILAWQHYETALRRFDGFPFRIDLMSRFRSPKQQEATLAALKRGEVDLLIGTHRIIQKDVQFRDLGLAIIDEEQRFGVAHKERFKEAFTSVDVLTLSATPIPRTLNMALSGLRDISVLEEAPMDRSPVQTYVMEYDRAVIADAIRRELRRGGQVYYLHNKVSDIEKVAAALGEMVPDARIAIAHGQMTEQQISKEWKRMMDHEIDVLLCTTIIEAGVDVANANTLIVENADRFGLSQLHQIRGRVGRSSRRAYAYLTFNGRRELSEIASKRLSAIREFTEFGSGMKIALRDLELRGAGNILGGEQSGHLDLVGYDMYMKLLNEAVAEEKGEASTQPAVECTVDLPIEAHIPESYIDATHLRLDVYRLIADIRSDDEVSDVVDELIDRFGDPPAAVMGLIRVALVRNRAAAMGISDVKHGAGNILFYLSFMDMRKISAMIGSMPGRVMLSAGTKPYLTVKPEKGRKLMDSVSDALECFASAIAALPPEETQESAETAGDTTMQ